MVALAIGFDNRTVRAFNVAEGLTRVQLADAAVAALGERPDKIIVCTGEVVNAFGRDDIDVILDVEKEKT